MEVISRREFLSGAVMGAGLVALAPAVPGFAEPLPPQALVPVRNALPGVFVPPFFEVFGIDDAAAGRIMGRALRSGGDFAEVYFEHTVTDNLKLEEGKVTFRYRDRKDNDKVSR